MNFLILNQIQKVKRSQIVVMALLLLVCRNLMKEEKKKNYETKQMKNFKAAVSFNLNAQPELNAGLIMRRLSNSFNASKLVKMTLNKKLHCLAKKG